MVKVVGGIIIWFNANCDYHREGDKPARIFASGRIEYWINGSLHREDWKPAIVEESGLGIICINNQPYGYTTKIY